MRSVFYGLAVLVLSFGVCAPALAGSAPTQISTQGAWKSYYFVDKGDRVCFMSSQPQKQSGPFKKRGEVFFFITHWPGDKDKNVVSISNGYPFKPDSPVTVKIDGKSYTLFTQGEMAWTKDQDMDNAITDALQKGSTLVVKGTSQHGVETTDSYSLKGSGTIFKTLTTACKNTAENKPKPAAEPAKPKAEKAKPAAKTQKRAKTSKHK